MPPIKQKPVMSTALMENTVKDKLGIKWVCARTIVNQALTELDMDDGDIDEWEDEVLLQCLRIFQSLRSAEQDEMRVTEQDGSEPAWKKKARHQAEKRERQWEIDAAEQKSKEKEEVAREERIARGEPEIKGPKKITRVTKLTTRGDATSLVETETHAKLEGVHVKHTKKVFFCSIL
jgi:hypothetical protein